MPKKNYDEDVREQGLEEERDAAFRSWVEKNSPHGAFKAVNADSKSDSAPYGGISFDDGFFVYNDGKGGHYTEWNGKKTPSDWLGNAKEQSPNKMSAVSGAIAGALMGSKSLNGGQKERKSSDDLIEKFVSSKSSSDARSLNDIYSEYLDGAYYKNAIEEGKRVAEDVLGKYASMTGGLPSTAATYAATSAGEGTMTDAQKYLWQLAQSQYESERQDARADAEAEKNKYTDMIDAYLSMGYGVDDIPDEWWVRSGYDRTYAGGVADYNESQKSAANEAGMAAEAKENREYFQKLIQTYVNKGTKVPSWMWNAAGINSEDVGAQSVPENSETESAGVTIDTYKNYTDYAKNALEMYNSGDSSWESYIDSMDGAMSDAVFSYIKRNADISARSLTYNSTKKMFEDEFGKTYTENELKAALDAEKKSGKDDLDVGKFIKAIKEKASGFAGRIS